MQNYHFFVVVFIIFYLKVTSCGRNQIFLTDICQPNPQPKIHLSLYKSRGEPAVTLSLSRNGFSAFNCCADVTSEHNIALEINDINLANDPATGSCIDRLKITTDTDNMAVCRQPDIDVVSPDLASNSVEATRQIKICYISSLHSRGSNEITTSSSSSYGFTLRIFAFALEKDADYCTQILSGFQCRNSNRCLPTSLSCDGEEDCSDGSDESDVMCDQVTDVRNPQVGISVQGAITLGGICVIIFVVIAMCLWQCIHKLHLSDLSSPPSNTRQRNDVHNLPMTVYTVPIPNLSSTNVAVSSSTSRTDTIVVSCSTSAAAAIEDSDLPPTYESLFANKTVTSTQTV